MTKGSVSNFFSNLAKSLQLPVAVLPAAGILVGIGQAIEKAGAIRFGQLLQAAGLGILGNLAILFALGLAIGFAKDHHGSAVLAAFVGYQVLIESLKILNPSVNMGVFAGILIGCLAGMVYNRFHNAKLPTYLAFFGGKRAVPIVMAGVALVLALILAVVWPPIQAVIGAFGAWMVKAGSFGAFTFGVFNRLLIPLGLHMILNSIFWFDLGTFTNAAGAVFTGDIPRFWAGDPTAGAFTTGFFPVMMFGLPAACLAMIVSAKKENRKAVVGMLGSMALTSFLTGITEPVEFSFLFLAFPLYVVHALLTGLSCLIMSALQVRLSFNFSAGLIDYVLGFNLAEKPLLLIPLGLAYGVVYFVIFTAVIKAFKLKTPGREDVTDDGDDTGGEATVLSASMGDDGMADAIIKGLGGKSNIKDLDACATRLRVEVVSNDLVSEPILKKAGAKGVLNRTQGSVQVIIGGEADQIATLINQKLKALK